MKNETNVEPFTDSEACGRGDYAGEHSHCKGCGCAIADGEWLCGECACEEDGE